MRQIQIFGKKDYLIIKSTWMQHPARNFDSNLTRNNDDNKHKRMINCGVKNLILNSVYLRPSSTMAKLSEITKPTAFPSQETQF
jgi:hypothetical protein